MPKSYSQYKHDDLKTLGVELKLRNFIKTVNPIEASDFLKLLLQLNTNMTLNTEKAKSEFLIAPILYEIARKNKDSISFFSGHNLNVDKDLGLKGFCDFLFTKVPESTHIKEPIFCIVEAKNDNLENGIAQCVAEMYAARLFNEQKNTPIEIIHGCVTTGFLWQFLKLDGSVVYQDTIIYSLSDLSKVLGILQFMVES